MVRAGTRFHHAVALLALILGLAGFIAQTRLAVLPERDRQVAFPARVGDAVAGNGEQLRFLAEGRPPGTRLEIVDASGVAHDALLRHAHGRAYLAVTILSGLCFLGVAAFVFAPKAGQAGPRDFFWSTLLYGTAVLIGGVYFPKPPVWPDAVLGIVQLACLGVLPVLFFHLVLVFPRPLGLPDRHRWLMPALWALAAAAVVVQSGAYLAYVAHPDPGRARPFAVTQIFADAFLVVLVGVAVVLLFLQNRRLELTRERQQTKWLLWGLTLGITPYVFLRTLPLLLGLQPPVGAWFDRVAELAIPAAFVFAVVRFRFLDIDIIIRRSLIYGFLAGGMVLLYLALALAGQGTLEPMRGTAARAVLLGTGLLAGIAFFPLRAAMGRWVDRTFFKLSHDLEAAFDRVRPRLESAASRDEACALAARFLEDRLGSERVAVVAETDGSAATGCVADLGPAAGRLEAMRGARDGVVAVPGSTSLPEVEAADFPAALREAGYVVAHPLGREGRSFGCLLLAAKRTGRRYVEVELDFTGMLAGELSTVLRRIELVQAVDAETRERRRLRELADFKNRFLSQAAHDLRTPVASISWSSANLLDGIAGDVTEAQAEYLRSIKVSSDALSRMVSNLVEISLLEQGVPRLASGPVALRELLDRAVTTIRPLAAEKSLAIRVSGDYTIPPVQADEEKLFEVALNLLDNAVKYSPPAGTVEIALLAPEAGRAGFSVRDCGPGLGAAAGESLFERFRQDKASPYSQKHGFGLGLYIARSFLELMDGSVEAANHPEGGAVFTCRIPVAPRPEGSS